MVSKINTDATFSVATNSGGWGFVVRDNEGGGCGSTSRMWPSSIQAETLAVLFTLEKAATMGMPTIIFGNRCHRITSASFGCRHSRGGIELI